MFYIIFSLLIVLYTIVNGYIISRVQKLFPANYKTIVISILIICASAFIIGRIVEKYTINIFSTTAIWIGSLWMGLCVYLFFGFLIIDIAKWIASLFSYSFNFANAYWGAIICSLLIVTIGYINAANPRIHHLNIAINKSCKLKEMKIAFVSDIHLGTLVANSRLQKLISNLNALQPDIILFGGDILDEDIEPVIANNLGDLLLKLEAPYGIFAVLGNHEYIGGIERALGYLAQHNIHILRDQIVKINEIQIIGRDDRSKIAFTAKPRKTLEELMENVDINKPIIVLDHQPSSLPYVTSFPVDLVLSGHTHHGQLFPFNFITSNLYKISWGYKKENSAHIYVSCGYGTWGPPLRTNSYPEIVFIHLKFAQKF